MSVSSLENAANVMVEVWWSVIVWSIVSLHFMTYIEKTATKLTELKSSLIELMIVITVYLMTSIGYSIVIVKNGFPLLVSLGGLIRWAGWGAPQGWIKLRGMRWETVSTIAIISMYVIFFGFFLFPDLGGYAPIPVIIILTVLILSMLGWK